MRGLPWGLRCPLHSLSPRFCLRVGTMFSLQVTKLSADSYLIYIYVCIHFSTCSHVRICIDVCICYHFRICIHVCVCVFVCFGHGLCGSVSVNCSTAALYPLVLEIHWAPTVHGARTVYVLHARLQIQLQRDNI